MENTKFLVISKISEKYLPDLTVYCVTQTAKDTPDCTELQFDSFQHACTMKDFKGKIDDELIIYDDSSKSKSGGKRIAFIGTGIIPKKIAKIELREKMRIIGGNIARLCKKIETQKICIVPPKLLRTQLSSSIYCLTEGIMLGDYTFSKYKTITEKRKNFVGLKEVKILTKTEPKNIRENILLAINSSIATCHARNMANEPGNSWTPESFAAYALEISRKHNLKCKIFDKSDMEKMGMGGILAVNKGSAIEPKLVVVEYHNSKKSQTVLIVGKGLTFDSGGISIKPAAGMEDMKYDMCGGAAVLAAMNAIGVEKPSCNVIAIVPATDNMSGASALKPGDIICHYNKINAEIINTDAEGRLILADALAYGVEKYTPDCVIDLATLTGAVIIGLGHHFSGVLSNNNRLVRGLVLAGQKSGEPLWRLPLGAHYTKQIESKVADIKNTGGKAAGTITAAEYLQKFVNKTPWAHIDIAGTAWGFTEKSYIPDGGPSGIGVRTLIEFVRGWRKTNFKEK